MDIFRMVFQQNFIVSQRNRKVFLEIFMQPE